MRPPALTPANPGPQSDRTASPSTNLRSPSRRSEPASGLRFSEWLPGTSLPILPFNSSTKRNQVIIAQTLRRSRLGTHEPCRSVVLPGRIGNTRTCGVHADRPIDQGRVAQRVDTGGAGRLAKLEPGVAGFVASLVATAGNATAGSAKRGRTSCGSHGRRYADLRDQS